MNRNPCSDDLYRLHGLMYLLHKLNAECYHLSFLFKALSTLWINNIYSIPLLSHPDFDKRHEGGDSHNISC